jgi:hypothetical protein
MKPLGMKAIGMKPPEMYGIFSRIGAALALLLLVGCQGTSTTFGYEPLAGPQGMPAADANVLCERRAAAARHEARRDIRAQGGQPAYHQTYASCMTALGWKRIVVSSFRYG